MTDKIIHGACPARRDINAPDFEWIGSLRYSKGSLEEYRCPLCQTVIFVFKRAEDE